MRQYDYKLHNNWVAFKNSLIYTVPNTLTCYHKIGLVIFIADIYGVAYTARFLLPRLAFYLYLVVKPISIILPFLYLSPNERMPFWLLYLLLGIFEVCAASFSGFSWGHGIDWKHAPWTHYRSWPKHFRYQRITPNRLYMIDLFLYSYRLWKILTTYSYFCYNRYTASQRLANPHVPVRGDLPMYTESAQTKATGLVSGMTKDERAAFAKKLGENLFLPPPPQPTLISYKPSVNGTSPTRMFAETLFAEPSAVANLRYGVLFLLALSSLSVYSIILAGWSSNSKYAFIGALRSAAQMISYEIAISLILLPVVALSGSLNLTMIVFIQSITVWFVFPLLPVAVMFLIAMLAETNRTPFDLPEAEAELVAGYNVDYSALPFAMFFLGEYCNMILMAVLFCLLFLGGWTLFTMSAPLILALKAAAIWVFFVLVRATLPRYRYDQLMDIGWKVFLPIAGGYLLVVLGVLLEFNCMPVVAELPLHAPTLRQLHLPLMDHEDIYTSVEWDQDLYHVCRIYFYGEYLQRPDIAAYVDWFTKQTITDELFECPVVTGCPF
jgi:NADH-quinone oxidoreductase subunit H